MEILFHRNNRIDLVMKGLIYSILHITNGYLVYHLSGIVRNRNFLQWTTNVQTLCSMNKILKRK